MNSFLRAARKSRSFRNITQLQAITTESKEMSSLIAGVQFMLILCVSSLCTFSAQVSANRNCRWNQVTILRPNAFECLDCPDCPEGHGLVPQCGSRITADVTVQCVQCKPGEVYSDKHDFSSCKPCTICDPNEEKISPCTATKNAVCGKCNAGYYRAVTGDCHPCSWCCADSKDEDIEKQCSEQTNIPANQICRYDVNTIKCAPVTNSTTTTDTATVTTKPAGSQGMVAGERVIINRGFWLVALVGSVALAVCVLIGILCIYYHKNHVLSQLLCARCVTTFPTQVVSDDPPSTLVVIGSAATKGQMV